MDKVSSILAAYMHTHFGLYSAKISNSKTSNEFEVVIDAQHVAMGKRMRLDEPSHDAQNPSKKSRHDHISNHGPVEEILNARQLQHLLVFEQDQARLLTCMIT